MTRKKRQDVYERITARLIEELEAGVVPWRRPWSTVGGARNLVSKKAYRGINTILLGITAYSSPWWVTYKQAKALGGTVRGGEHGTHIIFMKRWESKDTDEHGKPVKAYMVARGYTVFNVEQCDGLDAKIPAPKEDHEWDAIAEAEAVMDDWKDAPMVNEARQDRACYHIQADTITMPERGQFEVREEFYSTLFHEATHATGHESRLARFGTEDAGGMFGSESYSKEELTAEFGAAMLCGVVGIEPRVKNSAAYIANWLGKLREDTKLAVQAAARAQRGVDWILGHTKTEECDGEKDQGAVREESDRRCAA